MTAGGAPDSRRGAGDPEGEAAVQRLLAETGGPVEMPADVAARLDEVLADLERERSGASSATTPSATTPAHVVEMRARRRWPRLLLAAAAVIVGGYAVGAVVSQGTLSGADNATSADSATTDGAREQSQAESQAGAAEEGQGSAADNRQEQGYPAPPAGRLTLRSDRLEVDVRRALRVLDREVAATADSLGGDTEKRERRSCPVPATGRRDRSLPVRYDGEAAVLVAGPVREDVVEVTVLDCSGTELVTTLVRR